jgi:sugar phosphate isomerase/epimerase
MTTRRDFLIKLGGSALGITALPHLRGLSAAEIVAADRLERIGIQLYTLRSLMEKDFEGTIARVAGIGYKEVEFAGYFGRTPQQVRDVLKKNGLTSPSTHIPMPADDAAWAATLNQAKAIGHEWVVIPWIDEAQRKAPEDWARMADKFNALAAKAKAAGLRFAYHNHDFEFMKVGNGTGLDILLTRTDPALVDFEMDIYWIVKGGGNPFDFFARYPGRFKLMHAKDATAAPERTMVDVGAGTIPFGKIFAARAQSGMQHVYVEHDQPADPMASARASFTWLNALRF